jgi:predicted RNA-binding Zn-ribbon protein involved in translation (DUF1610 family)
MSKIQITSEIDHKYTEEITCPHCGQEVWNSWECSDYDYQVECGSCNKLFGYSRHVEVSYSSYKTTQEEIDKIQAEVQKNIQEARNLFKIQNNNIYV